MQKEINVHFYTEIMIWNLLDQDQLVLEDHTEVVEEEAEALSLEAMEELEEVEALLEEAVLEKDSLGEKTMILRNPIR